MNTQDNLQVELKGDDSLNQLSDRANKILKTLPTELQVYDSSHQISDRINEILEPMRGLRGAKNDFVTYFPEYNTQQVAICLKEHSQKFYISLILECGFALNYGLRMSKKGNQIGLPKDRF
jgi:hypothetical protein